MSEFWALLEGPGRDVQGKFMNCFCGRASYYALDVPTSLVQVSLKWA